MRLRVKNEKPREKCAKDFANLNLVESPHRLELSLNGAHGHVLIVLTVCMKGIVK